MVKSMVLLTKGMKKYYQNMKNYGTLMWIYNEKLGKIWYCIENYGTFIHYRKKLWYNFKNAETMKL